ncbi:hypothetical protein PYW07_017138 [Mythimna separata]|uniref:Peptidase M14 domain-containing protein n=1 Tax=Mythimna separata TaxID=271217 RepID=A0AAD8DX76_MYTSE|nr:hypothetical protein PYW07_017138 [Mythimna separata]
MKTYVFLITLGFIQLVFCNPDLNLTDHDLYSVCPYNFFRRKRSYADYTRWRANQDLTTNEFLVKVLDEDLTTPQTKKVVAVNILPVTAGGEKIIIGGAKVPAPTSASVTTNDPLKDYTRFAVPPTTPAIIRIDGEHVHAQKPPLEVTVPAILPPSEPKGISGVRHSQRDDSPPASPQFLARTPTLLGRQYAPIAPVAFNRRKNIDPVTPPSTSTYDPELESSHLVPTRVRPFSEITIPTRTSVVEADEFGKFNSFDEVTQPQEMQEIPTRSSFLIPERTMTPLEINEVETETESTTEQKVLEDTRKRQKEIQKVVEKDTESSYNQMFYNDEDNNDAHSKKDDQDISDTYFDKKGYAEDSHQTVASDNTEDEMEYIDPKNYTFASPSPDDNDSDNITKKTLSTEIPVLDTITLKSMKESFRDKRRPFCSLLTLRQLNFNSPRTLPEITNQLKQWAEKSPLAKCVDITSGNFTNMENPIYMMIVDDPSSGQIVTAKQTVMIVAGIQGRDHHAVAAAMYVLYQLIERSDAHADLLTRYRFWVVPVFNPDGYDYSMTFPHRREWTKNLRQSWDLCKERDTCEPCDKHGLRCLIQPCYGVNLDRNFEYQWIPAEELRAEHPCGSLYSGVRQLSELETRALTQFLHGHHNTLFTFLAFKEGDILGIMYPHSHTRKRRAYDYIYRQRALRAAAAASSISNRPYVGGQTSEFLPLYAGGIEDWVDGHLGIDNTYTIMMFRPTDASYNSKLITERVVHEAYAAMDTLLLQSIEKTQMEPARVSMKKAGERFSPMSHATRPRPFTFYILPTVFLLYG